MVNKTITASKISNIFTQFMKETNKTSLSASEISNISALIMEEARNNSLNTSEISDVLNNIIGGNKKNTLTTAEICNILEQMMEETKPTSISTSGISNNLKQMVGGTKKNTLTAAEVSNLWTQYMGDSLAICVYKYFLNIVEDKEIQSFLEFALQLSHSHIVQLTEFFKQANFQVPIGFTDNDVNLNAPRLFSDQFLIFYTDIMTIHGLTAYSLAITTSDREDIKKYFFDCTAKAYELITKVSRYIQSKGLYSIPPSVPSPEKVEFVEKKGDDF